MGSQEASSCDVHAHHVTPAAIAQPHAVLFPYPAQGHINPMMHLARKLLSDGFFITFINLEFNHNRMFAAGHNQSLLQTPNLRFLHVPDGLPPNHGRFNENLIETTAAILALPGPVAKLIKTQAQAPLHTHAEPANGPLPVTPPPVTCIIADSFCSWMQEVADQLSVPRVALWTTPASANLAYHFQSLLMDHGYSPLRDPAKASEVITCIPGIAPMKLQDHISFFLVEETTGFLFQWHLRLCMRRPLEAVWNLGNTWTEIDPDASAAFKAEVPNYLPIGPLLPDCILRSSSSNSDGLASSLSGAAPSLWTEDCFCNSWLSAHPPGSVLYIAYGSLANVSEGELANLIQGIKDSGVPFLWAVRPDQGGAPLTALRAELNPETASPELLQHRRVVPWAPQLEALNHPSVGAFLSHCGWNSILESIAAGVPILARAGGFAEQRMNAHYVSEVWKVGLRIEEGAGAGEVVRLVREVMREDVDVRQRCEDVRRSAIAAVGAGGAPGSSSRNYGVFLEDMRGRAAAAAALVSSSTTSKH